MITKEQARESLLRFIDGHFNKGQGPRLSVPARLDHDDDIVLDNFIDDAFARFAELEAIIVEGQGVGALPFDGQESSVALLGKRIGELEAENAELRAALDVAANAFKGLTWRVVANAGRLSEERKPRWSHVSDATAHGSTVSAGLCTSVGFDPDQCLGGES